MDQEVEKKEKVKTIYTVIIGLIGVGMMFIGLPGIRGSSKNVVVEINGEKFSDRQLSEYVANVQAQNPSADKENVKKEALGLLVERELLRQYARDTGYRFSDEGLKDWFKTEFNDEATYNEYLKARRITAKAFQNSVQIDESVRRYYGYIDQANEFQPKKLDELRAQQLAQKRDIKLITLPIAPFAAQVTVNEADLNKFYEEHKNQYLSAEEVDLEFVHFSLENAFSSAEITDADVQAEKEKRAAKPKRAGKYLIFDKEEDAQAANAAIKSGEKSLDDIAKEIEASKISGQAGDLQLTEKGAGVLPKEVDDSLFSLAKAGDISDVVSSEYGKMLIRLDEIKEDTTSDENIRKLLTASRGAAIYAEKANAIFDAINAGADINQVANKAGVKVEKLEKITPTSKEKDWVSRGDFQDLIFGERAVAVKAAPQAFEISPTESLFLVVTRRQKPEVEPLDKIRDLVTADFRKEQAKESQKEAAEKIKAALENSASLDDLLNEFSASSQNLEKISYAKEQNGGLDDLSLSNLMSQSEKIAEHRLATGDLLIAKIEGIYAGSVDDLDQNIRQIIEQQAQQVRANASRLGIGDYLRQKAKVKVNQDLLNKTE